MSDRQRDSIYFLEDILNACEKIEKYIDGIDFKTFSLDEKTIDAVIRNFEIIGEATRNVSEKIQTRYPQVEWKEAVGFRNIVVHNYFGIDLESVWETIQRNIPVLKEHVRLVLEKENIEISNKF